MNAVQAFLDEFSFPWRDSMAELVARFGAIKHPVFGWDVIMLETSSLPFPGMLFPVYTNAFRVTSSSPPDYFATEAWTSNDPAQNLRLVESFVTSRIGDAQVIEHSASGEHVREWRAGPAAIRISARTTASAFAGHVNPAQEREPRLATSCSIHIYPGYRKALSPSEAAQVRGADRLLRLPNSEHATTTGELDTARPRILETEFARDSIPECERLLGSVALSEDRQTVIVCARTLLIIPRDRVVRVEVYRRYPARGPGDSRAVLVCSDPASESGEAAIDLCRADLTDGLNHYATSLAALISKPVQINPAQPND